MGKNKGYTIKLVPIKPTAIIPISLKDVRDAILRREKLSVILNQLFHLRKKTQQDMNGYVDISTTKLKAAIVYDKLKMGKKIEDAEIKKYDVMMNFDFTVIYKNIEGKNTFKKTNELKIVRANGRGSLKEAIKAAKQYRRDVIQKNRAKIKKKYETNKYIELWDGHGENVTLIAHCFKRSGEILRLYNKKKNGSVFSPKKPRDLDRHIGIELEFFSDSNRTDLGRRLEDAELGQYVYLREDGSIRPEDDMYGHEINILVKENELETIVHKVCSILEGDNASVNDSCGFHVHLDMRSRNKDLAFSNLVSAQSILYAMQPTKRRNNDYCKRTLAKDFSAARNAGGRYWGINPEAFRKFQTIEIRIHTGTTNYTKVINWVKILMSVANKETEVAAAPRKVESFAETYGIADLSLVMYMNTRVDQFKGNEDAERGAA